MSDHKVESMKGKLKETIGDVTGDKGLQIEGKLDQAVASARKQIDRVTDTANATFAKAKSGKDETSKP